MSVEVMRSVIDAAEGRVPVDTLFTHAQIVDVYGQRVAPGSVAVKDGVIVGVLYDGRDDAAGTYEATEVIDCQGRYLAPGFIDGHLHIESSNIRPAEYARMAQDYAGTFCRGPQVLNLTALNGLVAFFLPVALLLAPGETDFAHFLTNFTFYAIFSAVVPTAMTKLMFVGEASQMSADSLARIRSIMESQQLPVPARPKHPVGSDVRFDDVSFTYEGTEAPAVSHVSFSVPAGSTLALVGPSGGGKSTCASLIPRFWDVSAGRVLVGGVDVRDYNLDVLRREVSMVLQKNVLFSGTILDNLRWGNENASEEECIRVAKLACADEFIERFPDKYNTWIEQGGSNVSGGQKQRLTIARALLRKPKVLILDDSTSAVDTATDAKIRKAFREEIPGTTKIIIAQRISSVQDADRILVLDNGQINGLGTHAELLATNAIYQEVYNSQTQGGGDFDKQGGAQ